MVPENVQAAPTVDVYDSEWLKEHLEQERRSNSILS
jgi:hypothetical protein